MIFVFFLLMQGKKDAKELTPEEKKAKAEAVVLKVDLFSSTSIPC